MTMVAGRPNWAAAKATPWPWLPAEAATTRTPSPRSLRRVRRFSAPQLERAGGLEVLQLQEDLPATGPAQGMKINQRGAEDYCGLSLPGCFNVFEGHDIKAREAVRGLSGQDHRPGPAHGREKAGAVSW